MGAGEEGERERERERDLKVQSQHIAGRSGVNTLSLLFENCYNVHRVEQTDRIFPSLKINLYINDLFSKNSLSNLDMYRQDLGL